MRKNHNGILDCDRNSLEIRIDPGKNISEPDQSGSCA